MPDRKRRKYRRAVESATQRYRDTLGTPDHNPAYVAQGPVRAILARFAPGRYCPHIVTATMGSDPRERERVISGMNHVVWVAWKPELLVCDACFTAMPDEYTLEGEEDNYRCDHCGSLTDNVAICTSVMNAKMNGFPPIHCMYGICLQCKTASNM